MLAGVSQPLSKQDWYQKAGETKLCGLCKQGKFLLLLNLENQGL